MGDSDVRLENAAEILQRAFIFVTFGVLAVPLVLYVVFINGPFIRRRSPYVELTAFAFMIMQLTAELANPANPSCFFFFVFSWFDLVLFIVGQQLRACALIVIHGVQSERKMMAAPPHQEVVDGGMANANRSARQQFEVVQLAVRQQIVQGRSKVSSQTLARRVKWTRQPRLLIIYLSAAIILLLLAYFLYLGYARGTTTDSDECYEAFLDVQVGIGCFIIAQSLVSVYLVWRLRHVRDQFSISTELRLMMATAICMSLGIGILFFLLSVPSISNSLVNQENINFSKIVLIHVYFFIQTCVTGVFPVVMNFVWMYRFRKVGLPGETVTPRTTKIGDDREARELEVYLLSSLPSRTGPVDDSQHYYESTATTHRLPFEIVVIHPQYRQLLREYLIEELSIENLQFLQDMKELKRGIALLIRSLVRNTELCSALMREEWHIPLPPWASDRSISSNRGGGADPAESSEAAALLDFFATIQLPQQSSDLRWKCRHIFDEYFGPNAPFELNLPGAIVQGVRKVFHANQGDESDLQPSLDVSPDVPAPPAAQLSKRSLTSSGSTNDMDSQKLLRVDSSTAEGGGGANNDRYLRESAAFELSNKPWMWLTVCSDEERQRLLAPALEFVDANQAVLRENQPEEVDAWLSVLKKRLPIAVAPGVWCIVETVFDSAVLSVRRTLQMDAFRRFRVSAQFAEMEKLDQYVRGVVLQAGL